MLTWVVEVLGWRKIPLALCVWQSALRALKPLRERSSRDQSDLGEPLPGQHLTRLSGVSLPGIFPFSSTAVSCTYIGFWPQTLGFSFHNLSGLGICKEEVWKKNISEGRKVINPDVNRNNYMAIVMKHNTLLVKSCFWFASLFYNLGSLHISTAKKNESHRHN